MTRTTTCTKIYTDIPFAHRQPNHEGHCALLHGHNWSFEFEFVASEKDACGFVVDFGGLKELKRWIDDTFDHALLLNASDPYATELRLMLMPTIITAGGTTPIKPQFARIVLVPDCSCEGLAEFLASQVQSIVSRITDGRVAVKRVTVYEDSKNSATCQAI